VFVDLLTKSRGHKTAMAFNVCEPLLRGSSPDAPVPPVLQNYSVTVPVPAANQGADNAADHYQGRQVKAFVTEIKKKRMGMRQKFEDSGWTGVRRVV
jgi:hypothetical protein